MDHSGSANGLNWMPTNRHRSSVGAQVCDTRVAYLDFSSRGRGVVALDRSHDRRVPEQPNVHLAGLQFVIDELIVTIDPLLTIEHEAARADRQEVSCSNSAGDSRSSVSSAASNRSCARRTL